MMITDSFEEARVMLTRHASLGDEPLPPRVQERINALFGGPISAAEAVRHIIEDVHTKGDGALRDYTWTIDGVRLDDFKASRAEVEAAYCEVSQELVDALKLAAGRIREFHVTCKKKGEKAFFSEGLGRKVIPLERVGIYVPGGTASYPSTVLMTALPARVAGVREIIMTSPPRRDGTLPPATLVAADIAGVDAIFKLGGAQAIAAMAWGTVTVPRVDKICGPGNIFVVLAKKMVFGQVDIDGLAGPSEVVVVADESADASLCAADLLAQAEHDAMAGIVFITTSKELARTVHAEVEARIGELERSAIAAQALKRGIVATVKNVSEAIELVNLYAPEHLSLHLRDTDAALKKITNAGCIFLGGQSPVPLGDYTAGPSHVLPTGGSARFSSPLGIADFLKVNNIIALDASEHRDLAEAAIIVARAEGLTAHARALELRLRQGEKK